MYKTKSGFTIVELLIVIVVIAILAAISIVAYSGIQERSRASAIASDIKQLDKAFRMFLVAEGRSTWWVDTEFTGGGNPQISAVVEGTNLKDYFQKFSSATTTSTTGVIYDNDGDTYTGCSATATGGVNIYLYGVSESLAQKIDDTIDDGSLGCGKVTHSDSTLRYNLSRSQAV